MTSTPVGVIGLGLMGRPVAVNLAAAGFDVLAWNRRDVGLTDTERRPAGGGSLELAELGELGARCEVVLSLLPDLPVLEPLLPALVGARDAGPLDEAAEVGGVASEGRADPGDGPGGGPLRTLVVMSTCSPVAVAALGQRLAAQGIAVVDAPMSGGVAKATDGTQSLMIGGDEGVVGALGPVFDAIAGRAERLGPLGAGSLTKACNQLVVAATTTALAEAMVIAQAHGLDRAAVLDALGAGLAASAVLDQKRHALSTDDFTVTGPAKYLVKDLGFARDAAGEAAPALPMLGAAAGAYARVVDDGLGDEDAAVVLASLRRHLP